MHMQYKPRCFFLIRHFYFTFHIFKVWFVLFLQETVGEQRAGPGRAGPGRAGPGRAGLKFERAGPGQHSNELQRAGPGRTLERAGPKNSGPSTALLVSISSSSILLSPHAGWYPIDAISLPERLHHHHGGGGGGRQNCIRTAGAFARLLASPFDLSAAATLSSMHASRSRYTPAAAAAVVIISLLLLAKSLNQWRQFTDFLGGKKIFLGAKFFMT